MIFRFRCTRFVYGIDTMSRNLSFFGLFLAW